MRSQHVDCKSDLRLDRTTLEDRFDTADTSSYKEQ